jgi:multiple sugar transport system substrate-binding protein
LTEPKVKFIIIKVTYCNVVSIVTEKEIIVKKCLSVLILLTVMLTMGMSLWASGQDDSDNDEVLKVNFWTAPNQAQLEFWNKKVAAFNEAGITLDGKTVQVVSQMMPEAPSSEAGIQNALATGTAPAASTNINRGFAATLASSGRIYDLKDDAVFKSIVDARSMSAILPGWAIDGGQYVLPIYVNAMGYHWNVPALKALGFDGKVPTTVADIEKLVSTFYSLKETEMKDMGIDHLYLRNRLLIPGKWWERWYDMQMQYEAFSGGKYWVTGNKLTMEKDTAEEVLELLGIFGSTLQTAEDTTAFERKDNPNVLQVTQPWNVPKYQAAGLEYGFDGDYIFGPPIVKNEGDIPYTFADSKGIVFYKGGNVTEEEHLGVKEFIKWVYTGEEGIATDSDWIRVTGMLPVRGDLLENVAFSELLTSNPSYEYQVGALPYAIPAMAHDKMVDIQTVLGEKGTAPYVMSVLESTSIEAPDASEYMDAAFEAMIKAGKLD